MTTRPSTNGIYVSPINFERLEVEFFTYCLKFLNDGSVEKFFRKEKEKLGTIVLAKGDFKCEGSRIEFCLRNCGDNHESLWKGTFKASGILFSIENPDFEDLEGFYRFEET